MLLRQVDNPDIPAVQGKGWESRRPLTRADGLGYSVHLTTVEAGVTLELRYLHHVETVYCISGEGTLTAEDSGDQHQLRPGQLYVLNEHDRHTLTAITPMTGLCIFTPPTAGDEIHDENGSYPATGA